MPPRPPLTTLVIHTWKEHGKPRPLSNEETSEASARARISRSISIDTHLTTHLPPPDDSLPHHARTHISRSSTLDDGLSLHVPHISAHAERATRYAMARSVSVEEGMRVGARVTCRLRLEDSFLSSPFVMTPVESDDEIESVPMESQRKGDMMKEATMVVAVETRLPPRMMRRHRRTQSTSGICVRGGRGLGRSPMAETVYESRTSDGMLRGGMGAVLEARGALGASPSMDNGLSAIANGEVGSPIQ